MKLPQCRAKGVITHTGSLGDVMKESIEAARTVVRSRASRLGISYKQISETDIHVHFLKELFPRMDQAQVLRLLLGLVSALTGIPVKADVAMTGEITLRGEVLPIGGLKEKTSWLHLRGGIKTVLIPKKTLKIWKKFRLMSLAGLDILPVRTIDQGFRKWFGTSAEPLERRTGHPAYNGS